MSRLAFAALLVLSGCHEEPAPPEPEPPAAPTEGRRAPEGATLRIEPAGLALDLPPGLQASGPTVTLDGDWQLSEQGEIGMGVWQDASDRPLVRLVIVQDVPRPPSTDCHPHLMASGSSASADGELTSRRVGRLEVAEGTSTSRRGLAGELPRDRPVRSAIAVVTGPDRCTGVRVATLEDDEEGRRMGEAILRSLRAL